MKRLSKRHKIANVWDDTIVLSKQHYNLAVELLELDPNTMSDIEQQALRWALMMSIVPSNSDKVLDPTKMNQVSLKVNIQDFYNYKLRELTSSKKNILKKKAYPEDKWQSQKEVVPIGLGERGWQAYEPYKQSSNGDDTMAMYWDQVKDSFFDKGNRWSTIVKELKQMYTEITEDDIYNLQDKVRYEVQQQRQQIESDKDKPYKSVLRDTELKKSVDQLMVNKDPNYINEVKKKIVDFVGQTKIDENDKKTIIQKVQLMRNPFDLMKYYYYSVSKFEIGSTETEVESDFGFFDGPTDLGKRPKGDFPSVQWMPRGQEDEDVDPNLTTASLKKKADAKELAFALQALIRFMEKEPGLQYEVGAIVEFENAQKAINNYLDEQAQQRSTTASTGNDGQVPKSKAEWKVPLFDHRGVQYFANEEDAKNYFQKAKKQDKDPSDPVKIVKATTVEWLKKEAVDPLLEEHEDQVAAKYGPEYNTALMHYNDAVGNGHASDRAFQYAIAEMKKVNVEVLPETLSEVIDTYSIR